MNCTVRAGEVGGVLRHGLGRLVCKECMVVVLRGSGILFVGMCILGAILGPFVVGLCY